MRHRPDIAIIGRACRLPGATGIEGLWQLLSEGRCAVSKIPEDRWSLERLGHPRVQERGKSYTWAAGVLDDIWSFDPSVFGISPREAEQMDPQQRLLLELTWEALEDAGIRPSAVAGTEVGVFVGASSLDYGNLRVLDCASGDAYAATGNTLSILSNRISYIFDLKGPSFTLDTACSSSLVALDAAVAALASGRIDTAVVAGVNVLASPFNFISFSNASMLSRTGLCQAFSAKADGYVRSEGGVVLVLQSAEAAARSGATVRSVIAASKVNSDGRTTGISLPSGYAQGVLLEEIYREAGITLDALAFVEAHGTGTPVGDPIEAGAIGGKLGRGRTAPLPIGSIKTNIGHTEPVSGLAGLLKASLALEHDLLPPSLHCETLNPGIRFDDLNLAVNRALTPLPRTGAERFAGVNSFGFGGTNAHVILTDPKAAASDPKVAATGTKGAAAPAPAPEVLLVSAQTRAALNELAESYAERLEGASADAIGRIAAAAAHRRERLPARLAVPLADPTAVTETLRAVAAAEDPATGALGTAVERAGPVAFVYSGNGSQWAGMGRDAYATSPAFRARFDEADALFQPLSGWSLKEALFAEDLEQRLALTSVSQPLIFAIESAATVALRAVGLEPGFIIGHSVGEIAAAEAAGILSLPQAVRVIFNRSKHQESTRGRGTMAVLLAPVEEVEAFLVDFPDLDIAALNSPKAVTVAGPVASIDAALKAIARKRRRGRKLDLDYAFHGRLMDPIEGPLLRDLKGLSPSAGTVPLASTVTGDVLAGRHFDAAYWWRNIREPVRFSEAVQAAAKAGARVFVEVGPRPTLLPHIGDCLEPLGIDGATLGVLHKKPSDRDPFLHALAGAIVQGAAVDEAKAFGRDPAGPVSLPAYPWQRRPFRLAETTETLNPASPKPYHPLIGARIIPGGLEWMSHLDIATSPDLDDHRIEGQAILPGAAFVEMALAVAREHLGTDAVTLADVEIQQPMVFAEETLREVHARFAPGANQVQILSRPRLAQAAWQLHAVAKIVEGERPVPPRLAVALPEDKTVSGEELYQRAVRSGLGFGPSFRQVARSARIDETTIVSELLPAEANPRFGLVPARLDSCFHGLILLFADLLGENAGKAYVPVRFGEVRLLRPGAAIARAQIRTRRCNERSILADFTLVDAEGEVIATLREGRFQALRAKGGGDLDAYAIRQSTELATEPTAIPLEPQPSVAAIVRKQAPGAIAQGEAALSPGHMLLEGWATALAYRLTRGLARGGIVDLAATARLPEALRAWFVNQILALEGSGLAEALGDGRWKLRTDVTLPDPDEIMRWIAADHPDLSAELLLCADLGAVVGRILDGSLQQAPVLPQTALDGFALRGATVRASAATLMRLMERAQAALPRDRALRLLQIGFGPLSALAAAFAAACEARLTILETDRRLAERARIALPSGVTVVEDPADLPQAGMDAVLASDVLHRSDRDLLGRLAASLATGGLFAAVEPSASLFRDLVFGLTPGWFEGEPDLPVGRLDDVAGWQRALSAAGLVKVAADRAASQAGNDLLLLAEAPPRPRPAPGQTFAFIIGSDDDFAAETASSLATLLVASGVHVSIILDSEVSLRELARETPDTVVYLAGAFARSGDPAARLGERCLSLKRCVEHLGTRPTRLWVVCPGATGDRGGPACSVEAGVWAFTRTLANEVASLDVRRIDLAQSLTSKRTAERLRDLILSGTPETEIVLDEDRTRVVRFAAGGTGRRSVREAGAAPAARLERSTFGGLNEMRWGPADRVAPGPGQVEIAVAATGLNFRDVLWALSMLPEEILEDGFAGPRLGLECAGRVTAVGAGVTAVAPGDAVVAFAQSGFATHVVVPEMVVAPAPQGMTLEAAATTPVAFLTAFYGLVTLARLKAGEWVLVHGGAGGVGLAALQIALSRGARVIATAGSTEKRALVRALGAEHVLDSRSLGFVDDIRRITGEGVDVVLNSLSGEAMERSLNVLKPFGRFVELGKRDYVANTHIGLRPFRRNLSYFGVDLDQLLQFQPEEGQRLFREVMALFADGTLKPLPFQPFAADEVSDAFRLMQQSGHVGKIVIAPPKSGTVAAEARRPFAVAPDRSHLITGGLGGFGIEAARWLADQGATHIVLVGRKAPSSEEALSAIAELTARGVNLRTLSCDITDRNAVETLLTTVEAGGPPLAGIIHGAMVLQDGLIANIDPATLDAVLAPKVTGASHLDALTRTRSLDYFVLFSSATTFIGNPGQGAYVAANGFMEGLARQRRRLGLPALAVAWGAIGDVGVLARNRAVMETLSERVGVTPVAARKSLDLMAEALSLQGPAPDDAVLAIAAMHWGKARERLATLKAPSYAALGSEQQTEAGGVTAINIPALLRSLDIDEVRKVVADAIVEDVARILRLPKDDLSRVRQLSEIGLDSLMGVELGASLQERFGLEAPPAGVSSGQTVLELADTLIQAVAAPVDESAAAVMSLAQRHAGESLDASQLDPLQALVEEKSREIKVIL